MKKSIYKIALLSIFSATSLFASNSTDVEQLVDKAYKFCEEKGLDACIKAFNEKDKRFTKGPLYVFVSKFSGVAIAHGGNSKLIGKDLSKVKSPSGIYPGVEMAKIAKEKGSGWLDYKWSHPVTKKIADKTTYVKRFKDTDVFIASGYYK